MSIREELEKLNPDYTADPDELLPAETKIIARQIEQEARWGNRHLVVCEYNGEVFGYRTYDTEMEVFFEGWVWDLESYEHTETLWREKENK